MNFDEKDSMLFDDEEKKSIGLPLIMIAVILCIIVGAVVVALKYNGMDFNFKSVNTSRVCVFVFTFDDVIVRIMGIFFLAVSLWLACRKMVLDDNDSSIYWYKIIICMMVGSTFMILGSSIITVFVTLLTDIYR